MSEVSFQVRLHFSPGLRPLLYSRRGSHPLLRRLAEKTSAKDLIESCGVPHTEVDQILADGSPVDFSFAVDRGMEIQVRGVNEVSDAGGERHLQPVRCRRFVADGHLGKLVRWLRLLGIDVAYAPQIDDIELLRIMQEQDRALLTRDRRLLMHRIVELGYCPRSDHAETQAEEVLRRFQFGPDGLVPFSRCLRCNGRLQPVAKSEIESRLEPLTKRHYEVFRQCVECGRIYWAGSHAEKLRALVERVTGRSPDEASS